MPRVPADWIWFDLLTSDLDAAEAFYRDVVGWEALPGEMPGIDYRMLRSATAAVAGMMHQPDDMHGGPTWMGYVAVADVDRAVQAVEAAGGSTLLPGTDIPDVGRFALVSDRQGVPFYIMSSDTEAAAPAFNQTEGAHGHVGWCELLTAEPDDALGFYGEVFGWEPDGGLVLADVGDYHFMRAGDTTFGAITGLPDEVHAAWQFYFQVPDIDAAASRIRALGGLVVVEPEEIPDGGFSLIAIDPQGARFGLSGPRRH